MLAELSASKFECPVLHSEDPWVSVQVTRKHGDPSLRRSERQSGRKSTSTLASLGVVYQSFSLALIVDACGIGVHAAHTFLSAALSLGSCIKCPSSKIEY